MEDRGRILIVDDDRTHLDMAEEIIGERFDVTLAVSGDQALDILRDTDAPDLILLDVDMPGRSGFETYNMICEMERLSDIPVIFLTGMTSSESELDGLRLGAQDYITKPFAKENLLARVTLRLGEARRLRQMRDRLRDAEIDEERFEACTRELTPAEREVARLIVLGCGNQEIARRLSYTAGYVRNLATLVYDKLGIRGRQELREMFRK